MVKTKACNSKTTATYLLPESSVVFLLSQWLSTAITPTSAVVPKALTNPVILQIYIEATKIAQ